MKKIIYFALFFTVSLSLFAEEKYDWLIKHNWLLETELFDILSKPYQVIFRKLEVLPGITMYQERLRQEWFSLGYQTDQLDKLFIVESTISKGFYDVKFNENYTSLELVKNKLSYGLQNRVGKQENKKYPLVGIWGELPYLTEYRIVDTKDCFIYMEIERQFPFWAIREGTYLLKQINENTFETVSSFPDGRLRLTVENESRIILTPLFTLPKDEKGRLDPLIIRRWP
ncbi:hypothetical protein R84B8_00860 [Treponema sp. R8-4-B8]